MKSALTWFEIPTIDLERARVFYEAVLQKKFKQYVDGKDPMYLFDYTAPATGGALVKRPQQKPCADGTLVYLYLDGDVSAAEQRVREHGGSVLVPKMTVPGVPGELFVMLDTEGNMVGVHGQL